MRWLLTFALLALIVWPAAAQENEAEKLFRGMEENVRAAKTLQIRFDANVTSGDVKKWNVKGTLMLGEGDKLRAEAEGTLFGEESKFTQVSDGTAMKSFGYTKAPGKPKQDRNQTEKPPKGAGAYMRESLPFNGFCWSFLEMDRRSDLPADLFKLSDFKLAGKEKIGERDTQMIQYTITVKEKGRDKDANVLSVKMWLDVKTNLPVKLVMTGGKSGVTDITETYSEFTVNAKVDAKLFELPKDAAPKNLKQALDLNGRQVTNAVLKEKLAGLKNMQTLRLIGTQVTDAGLKELAGLKCLQVLNLTGTKVTDMGLKELAVLTSLQTLDLGGTEVTDAGLKELAGLKTLQALSLNDTRVTDAGLKELAGLRSLQNLQLVNTKVTDAGLKELAGLKGLQYLGLGGTEVTDTGLKELTGLKSLQFLDLGVTKVTDVGLKEFAGLKCLKNLDLGGTEVTDTGLKELVGLKGLQKLGLTGTQVTDAGLKELAGFKSLLFLDLGRTQVTNAGLKELTGLKSLQTLWLGRTKVTDAGLKELAGLKSLQFLDLSGTDVTDAGLMELAGLDGLQTLGLIGTKVTAVGVTELSKALPKVHVSRR